MQVSEKDKLIAGLDAGGTTFKCALATLDGHIVVRERFSTKKPSETIEACRQFFRSNAEQMNAEIAALGIASFGPVDVDENSESFGKILNTPKPGWSQTDLRGSFAEMLGIPVTVDTDVNGALLAEMETGAAKGCASAVYVTIGTGVGAGIFSNGALIGKPTHPEFGHIPVRRHKDDAFTGTCSFHGDCLEGMASAKAFTERFGSPQDLPQDHHGWQILANYLGQACWALSLSFRPERILLGGGLMLAPHLIGLVRGEYAELSSGYLGQEDAEIELLIARPHHGDDAGLLGGLYLARQIL